METPQGTSGIKKTWGVLLSLFFLVLCGLAMYYSYLIMNFFDKQKYIPIVFIGLPILVFLIIYFTIRYTWNKWAALATFLLLMVIPIGYYFFIHDYCSNCQQQVDFISKMVNYTRV